jgi:hypothetical protein
MINSRPAPESSENLKTLHRGIVIDDGSGFSVSGSISTTFSAGTSNVTVGQDEIREIIIVQQYRLAAVFMDKLADQVIPCGQLANG